MSTTKLLMAFILLFTTWLNNGFAQSDIEDYNVDGMPPIYREILNEYQHTYQEIGRRKALAILDSNGKLQVKGLNHIGFSMAKDFAAFSVDIKRDVRPDLFHDTRFIVTDEISISISASKLFGNLSPEALEKIQGIQKGAFAGVSFVRVHRNVHFAESFNAGLTAPYKYLFLGFMPFYNSNINWESDNVFSSREDYFSVKAGGMAVAPITGYLSAAVGILAKYVKVSRTTLEYYAKGEISRIRLSYEKEKNILVGANASIYLGFANILKLTLLSYDYNYTMSESLKYNLDFEREDLENSLFKDQINKILKGKKPNIDHVAPYLISTEERMRREKNSKFKFLLWSKEKDEKTEQVKIVKDNTEKTFFRHQYSNISYQDGLWSTLLSALLGSQIGQGISPNKKKWHKKTMFLEYASERNLLKDKEAMSLPSKEEISLKFDYELNATKKTKKLMRNLAHNTAFKKDLLDLMDANGLKPPYLLVGHTQLGVDAIDEFAEKESSQTHSIIQYLCSDKGWRRGYCERKVWSPYEKYINNEKQNKSLKKALKKCRRSKWFLARFFNKFRSNSKRSQKMQGCLEKVDKKFVTNSTSVKSSSLNSLKDFFQNYYNYADNKLDMYYLFGIKNVFNHGSFQANTTDNNPVTIFYKEGKFQGLGAINNYRLIENPNRSPASVLIPQ